MDYSGRRPKIHTPNSIHHVMVRGNNRHKIFFAHAYYEYFLQIIADATSKYHCQILAYCLMTNHVHLIIHTNEHPLSIIMQNICYRYVRWVNKKLSRIGHLFQGRYRSIPIKDEAYLIYLCRYIHLNPVDANMVSTPHTYPWSSHKYYIFQSAPPWLNIKKITQIILKKTALPYDQFMKDKLDKTTWEPAFYIDDNGQFIFNDTIIKSQQLIGTTIEPIKFNFSIDDIAYVLCDELSIQVDTLRSGNRTHKISYARAIIVYLALRYTDCNRTNLADYFNRSPATITKLSAVVFPNTSDHNKLLDKIKRRLKDFEHGHT